MRVAGAIVLAICLNWLSCQAALAEKRVALVIGNSAYQGVTKLANPVNDSAAIATMMKGAGFDIVELRQNLKINEMRRALRDFADRVRGADIVIVYFAGHGIEIDGVNYLIPVDAVLERDIDAYDEAISLDRILTVIEPARKLRLVILDACRDNPFSRVMRRTSASRAIDRGLAKVEPTSPNTLVAFAAKAGSTALDGDSGNSPFTDALIRHLPKPGLDLRKAFGFVRDEVLRATNNKQEPFIYGSLGGEDVALVAAPRAPAPDADAKIRRDYELAERVGTREAWDFFLATYPDGFYAKLAVAQRNKLAAEEARLSAVEKARRALEEQQRLAMDGARTAEQKKAAEQARAAEEARIAAEKKKAIEDTRLAEAERARAVALAKAAADAMVAAEKARKLEEARLASKVERDRFAAEKKTQEEARVAEAARARVAAEAKAAEEARIAAEKQKPIDAAKAAEAEKPRATTEANAADAAKAETDKPKAEQNKSDQSIGQLASLSPPDAPRDAKSERPSDADLPRLLLAELKRVGCSTGTAGDAWNGAAQKALGLFNKNAKTKFDVKVASLDALGGIRSKSGRVCPLICNNGYRADGDNCVKINCAAGYELGDDNTCERIQTRKPAKPVASAPAESPRRESAPAASGKDMAALYAQCRAQSRAEGRGGGRRSSFARIDACARNGGRL